MRKCIAIDRELAQDLREFAEKKHGMVYGAVKVEAETAIRKHIVGE